MEIFELPLEPPTTPGAYNPTGGGRSVKPVTHGRYEFHEVVLILVCYGATSNVTCPGWSLVLLQR